MHPRTNPDTQPEHQHNAHEGLNDRAVDNQGVIINATIRIKAELARIEVSFYMRPWNVYFPITIQKKNGSKVNAYCHAAMIPKSDSSNKTRFFHFGILISEHKNDNPIVKSFYNNPDKYTFQDRRSADISMRTWKFSLSLDLHSPFYDEIRIHAFVQSYIDYTGTRTAKSLVIAGEPIMDSIARRLARGNNKSKYIANIIDVTDTNWTTRIMNQNLKMRYLLLGEYQHHPRSNYWKKTVIV